MPANVLASLVTRKGLNENEFSYSYSIILENYRDDLQECTKKEGWSI